MTIMLKLLPALVLAGVAASAQQTAYDFKTVLRPESQIGGYSFRGATLGSAAINDQGEVALIVHWIGYTQSQNYVFTLRRLVAKEGDALEYGMITAIALYGHIAIS